MSAVKKGRKLKADPVTVVAWRQSRKATIAATAKRFGISVTSVKNHCRGYSDAAHEERRRWQMEQESQEADELERGSDLLELKIRLLQEADEQHQRDGTWGSFFSAISAANRLVPQKARNKKPR